MKFGGMPYLGYLQYQEKTIKSVPLKYCLSRLLHRGYEVTVGKYGEKEVDFIAKRQAEKIYIQVSYILATPETVEREFGVYKNIRDNYPKYVLSLDEFNMSRDGIIHQNIRDFLLEDAK